MAIENIADSVRNAACDAFVDTIDGGGAAGKIKIYDTAGPDTLLGTLTFTYPNAFGAAVSGTATAAAITPDSSADASGTAVYFNVTTSADTVLWKGSIGLAGADLIVNTIDVTVGDTIEISSASITFPAS